MKKMLTLALALCMILALAAPALAADEGAVYYLNFKPELDTALQQLAEDYTAETGVPVKVVTAASGTYGDTLTAEMSKSEAPTLFVLTNNAMVDEWGDYAMDLAGTPVAEEAVTDDYNLFNEDGALVGLGYCYESYGIITNVALLEEAGYELASYTGYLFEQLLEGSEAQKALLSQLNVLIDGPFLLAERSLELNFRGSRNQRVLNIPASLAAGKAVEETSPRWLGDY